MLLNHELCHTVSMYVISTQEDALFEGIRACRDCGRVGQKKDLRFLSETEVINLAITYSHTASGGTTIGGCVLNVRVRNGNECFHTPIVTRVAHRVVQTIV